MELKFLDTVFNDATVTNSGEIIPTICDITQGQTGTTRIGRTAVITRISINYAMGLKQQIKGPNPVANDSIRFIVYLDRQCNGATALVTDILAAVGGAKVIRNHRNRSNQGRFVFLFDRVHNLVRDGLASETTDTITTATSSENFSWEMDCAIKLDFNAAAGAITSLTSNNIGMLVVSEEGKPDWDAVCRVLFTDY